MDENDFPQTYLGDGVYAKFDGYGIWIYTSNGISTTNSIYIEPDVWKALVQFRKEAYAKFGVTV